MLEGASQDADAPQPTTRRHPLERLAEFLPPIEQINDIMPLNGFASNSFRMDAVSLAMKRVTRFEDIAVNQAMAMEFKPGEIYTPTIP